MFVVNVLNTVDDDDGQMETVLRPKMTCATKRLSFLRPLKIESQLLPRFFLPNFSHGKRIPCANLCAL